MHAVLQVALEACRWHDVATEGSVSRGSSVAAAAAAGAHQQRQHTCSLPPCSARQHWDVFLRPPRAQRALTVQAEVLVEHITHLAHTCECSFLCRQQGSTQGCWPTDCCLPVTSKQCLKTQKDTTQTRLTPDLTITSTHASCRLLRASLPQGSCLPKHLPPCVHTCSRSATFLSAAALRRPTSCSSSSAASATPVSADDSALWADTTACRHAARERQTDR